MKTQQIWFPFVKMQQCWLRENASAGYQYQYKIQVFYFGDIWPYWKMDTGKHNFHEILLLMF